PLLDLVGHVRVLPQEVAGVLLTLAELVALVGVPGAGLAHDRLLDAEVDQAAFPADPDAVQDVELGHLERRRHLVLDDLHLRPVTDWLGTVLERLDPAYVEPYRGIELQRLTTGGGLGAVVHHDAVDEVVVATLDLDVESGHRSRRWLDADVQDPGRL